MTSPSPTVPRPEYPRPHFDRSHSWVSLNGQWDFARDPGLDGAQRGLLTDRSTWARDGGSAGAVEQITVPFCWDSEASGVDAKWCAGGWYRRSITVPAEWSGQRIVLHFGAVHHEATVFVGATEVGRHVGGYLPFEFDITEALAGSAAAEVTVRVSAPIDKRDIAHGKQRSVPRDDYDDCAFSPSSGIWQSVWLEARPATFVESVRLRPTAAADGIDVTLVLSGPNAEPAEIRLEVLDPTDAVVASTTAVGSGSTTVRVPNAHRWSPADPYLYRVRVLLTSLDGTDTVTTYTGLRTVAAHGTELFLNGERLYVRGVLDQGYWPTSSITAPTDEAFVTDLELTRRAGFNVVRKHLKTEDPRFLFHADRLGLLVWAEPASTGRFTPAAVEAFEAQIEPMVERDGNHPSIVIWGLYNEEWGLDWDVPNDPAKIAAVRSAMAILKANDASRPTVDNSGWAHVETDLLDWHIYTNSPREWREVVDGVASGELTQFGVHIAPDVVVQKSLLAQAGPAPAVPNLNSEYAGGFTSAQRGWNQRWQTQELRRHDGLSGYVWTELCDIEHEMAGVYTEERRAKDLGGADPALAHAETVLVLDIVPVTSGQDVISADGAVEFVVQVSHHGSSPIDAAISTRWLPAMSPLSPVDCARLSAVECVAGPSVTVKPFQLSEPVTVAAQLPVGVEAGRLAIFFGSPGDVAAAAVLDVARSLR